MSLTTLLFFKTAVWRSLPWRKWKRTRELYSFICQDMQNLPQKYSQHVPSILSSVQCHRPNNHSSLQLRKFERLGFMTLSLIRGGLARTNVHSGGSEKIINPPCIIDGLWKENQLSHSALISHYYLYPQLSQWDWITKSGYTVTLKWGIQTLLQSFGMLWNISDDISLSAKYADI